MKHMNKSQNNEEFKNDLKGLLLAPMAAAQLIFEILTNLGQGASELGEMARKKKK